MCGISGVAGRFDPQTGLEQVRALNRSLEGRGPDAEGLESWPGCVLGHRRLSIFDLSELGRQPMLSSDRGIGVVFNGAIYNFLELRRELEAAGYAFRSRTDTEILVHGYRHWGIDKLLPRLRGMFAIAIWDAAAGKLTMFRDRLGVKPLYYAERNGQFAFASTARALHAAGFASELDLDGVSEFLEYGYVTDDRSIYAGVRKVPAAGVIEWTPSSGARREWQYWQLPEPSRELARITFGEAVEQAESIFLDAVKMRLEADVKVGALLSGGVDSSLVCWAIARHGGNIGSFTIGTPNDPMDESADAVATARKLGIPHQVIPVDPEDSPGPADLAAAYGEPFACASALGMLRVSKAVKQEATVLLTGDGGDDIFLGYPEHKVFWMAERLAKRVPGGMLLPAWKQARKALPQTGLLRRAKHFGDYILGGLGAVAAVHDGLPFYEAHGLLGPKLRGTSVTHRSMAWSAASARNLMTEFLAFDRRTRFTGEYMTKVDGGAMRYAVEARSPFLDHVLWEFAGALPYGLRLEGGVLKAILREMARRNIGERVATGAKKGFGIPVQRWVAGRWGAKFQELMSESRLAREGWINSGRVLETWKKFSAAGEVPNQLWYLFVLETWFRQEQAQPPVHQQPPPVLQHTVLG